MTQDVKDIWQEVHRRLRTFIARRVANEAEVEDILQEVFLRLHRRLDSLKDPRRLVSWVFQITRHAIADFYRAPERKREVPAGLAADIEAAHPATAQPLTGLTADSGQLREELAACMRPMIAQLSDREFRVLHHLVEHSGEVVSRERLLSEIWGYHFDPGSCLENRAKIRCWSPIVGASA